MTTSQTIRGTNFGDRTWCELSPRSSNRWIVPAFRFFARIAFFAREINDRDSGRTFPTVNGTLSSIHLPRRLEICDRRRIDRCVRSGVPICDRIGTMHGQHDEVGVRAVVKPRDRCFYRSVFGFRASEGKLARSGNGKAGVSDARRRKLELEDGSEFLCTS